jgi:hypothetical protein
VVHKSQKSQVCWVPVHLHHQATIQDPATIQGPEHHRYPWKAATPACQWECLKECWSGWSWGGSKQEVAMSLEGWKQGVVVVVVMVVVVERLKARGQRKQGKRCC